MTPHLFASKNYTDPKFQGQAATFSTFQHSSIPQLIHSQKTTASTIPLNRKEIHSPSKIKDLGIVDKWRQEILVAGLEQEVRYQLREEQLDYVFKELEWNVQRPRDQIDKGALYSVKKLGDVADARKDRHPGSNNHDLDLVHPSLYPLIAGRTWVTEEEAIPPLDFITAGKALDVVPAPKSSAVDSTFYSRKHQWLLTELYVSPEGKVNAKSYINNLHPVEHKEMYPVLEEILDKVLPMFEEVLSEYDSDLSDVEIDETDNDYDDDGGEVSGGEGEYRDGGKVKKARKLKKVRLPQPIKISDLKTQGKPLQISVKLANIELTPDNPNEPRLEFSIQIKELKYEKSDDRGAEHLHDVMNEDALIQYLDGITTQQDRCVVLPNIYQHQEHSFGLADRTKTGSRKLLAFSLVNPEEPVLSTTFVPSLRKEWDSCIFLAEVSDRLPTVLMREIDQLVD
ncbi:hypothetical protein EC957_001630 [Mortierella hygrophila]|uniref:DUF4246 domain-containing protein n=1 Tax=Mortierella hygrophila TaxID=979708 RepID=A0A9P6FFK1_9FUNG|nr:hypothetical protein EC957_001630 [Mortierella hygrophila]